MTKIVFDTNIMWIYITDSSKK